MFCCNCGADIADGVAFCSSCGMAANNAPNQGQAPVQSPVHMQGTMPVPNPAMPQGPIMNSAPVPGPVIAQSPVQGPYPVQGPFPGQYPGPFPNPFQNQNAAANKDATILKDIAAHPVDSFTKKVNELAGGEGTVELRFKDLFSDVFKKHSHEQAEEIFICGTSRTTPAEGSISAEWPKPWLFSRVAFALLIAFMALFSCWKVFYNVNAIPGIMVLGSFVGPFSILILFMEVNAPRNISFYEVLKIFFIGGCFSLFVTLCIYSLLGVSELNFIGAILVGFIEEVGKILVTIFFIKRTKKCKYALNGLLIGGAVGAGFAAFESAGYAFRMYEVYDIYAAVSQNSAYTIEGFNSMINNIMLRGFLAPGGHVAWAAIEGAAFMLAYSRKNHSISSIFDKNFLSLCGICVILHSIWDMPFELPFMIKYIILIIAAWIALIVLITRGLAEINNINQRPNVPTPQSMNMY